MGQCSKPSLGGVFALTNPNPSSLTVTGTGLGNGGLPALALFDANLHASGQATAYSVASDGSSATFPFPQGPGGNPLSFGHYSFSVTNPGAAGAAGVGLLTLAKNDTSKTSPFGVEAIDIANTYTQCWSGGGSCSTTTSNGPSPIITYTTTGEACISVYCAPVGATPVAVKAYGPATVSATGTLMAYGISLGTWTSVTTGPHYAMVANYDSNTVTRLDILSLYTNGTFPVVNTIAVGSHPVALAMKPDQTKLYVANYGSATVSEIDLNSQTVTRTMSVGSSPLSLSVDPSGGYLWVGGLNYVAKVDMATLSIASSMPVAGQICSLAVSAGQNSIVYNTVSTSQNQYWVQSAGLPTGAAQGSYVSMSTWNTPFASSSPGYLLSSATMVSANFNNRYAVTSTPAGFALIDLQTQTTMFTGSTPSAVRGIAIDPSGQMIYITAPESNSFISVPGPPTP